MRGAGRESTCVLLEHIQRRLTAHVHELSAAADEHDLLWPTSVDLAALLPVIEELISREALPTRAAPVVASARQPHRNQVKDNSSERHHEKGKA